MDHSGSWHSGDDERYRWLGSRGRVRSRPGEWRTRYLANVTRLRSGERDQIAEVVTALTARDTRYGLSQGERRILNRAIEMLAEVTDGDTLLPNRCG